MNKSLYIFFCLIFAVNFWDLSVVVNVLTADIVLVLDWMWILSGIYFFNENKRLKSLNSYNYNKPLVLILAGVFISMFSAYFFGGQSLLTTLIAQRPIYSFMFLPAILFVQPTEKDIIKALKWISIGTIVVWVLVHFKTDIIKLDKEKIDQFEMNNKDLSAKLEFYVTGIHLVVLYVYIKIYQYIKKFSWDVFLEASLLLIFIILYQNRSMILGVIPVFIYSMYKFKSTYKSTIIIVASIAIIVGVIYTSDVWKLMIENTQSNLGETDYNRWKALYYYFGYYSSNWFCYVFGNGYPSGGNSPLGNLMWANFEKGIFTSDLGMIGMWVDYGILPLIAIYGIIISILRKNIYPLYLKFVCLHIVFVPTIFHFWSNPGIALFSLIIYMHAYYTDRNKKMIQYARNNNS